MTTDPSSTITTFNDAVVKANSAAAEINDFLFSSMYKSNWGELLQPAPMAILILSNLTVVASAADFKLVAPKGGFEYVKYPDSFRATVVQLVDNGVKALEASYVNFDDMQKRCAGVKPGVINILNLLQSSHDDISRHLPSQISQLRIAVERCLSKAKETDRLFQDLLYLTMELHESCTATQGDVNAKLSDAKMRQTILQEQKKSAEYNNSLAQQQAQDARAFYKDARDQFQKAADGMPKAWDLVGLQFVEGLSQAVLGTVHAGLNLFGCHSQATLTAQYEAINTAGGVSDVPKGATVVTKDSADIAYQKGPCVYTSVLALEVLATAGPNGGVDWDKVADTTDSGVAWLRNVMQTSLDGKWSSHSGKAGAEGGVKAQSILKQGIKLAQGLQDAAPTRNEAIVSKLVRDIKQLAVEAMAFATTSMAKTGAIPMQNPGFAAPAQMPTAAASSSAAKMAIKNAQFKLEATQKQLDASRQMSQDATNKLLEVSTQLGEVLGHISALDMQKIDWEKLRAILLRAIALLCQLKGCLTNLVRFFESINNLVSVTMNDTASQFIQLITDATKSDGRAVDKSVGGVTFSQWTCQAIFNQALGAAKVARLVQNISEIYLKMYRGHVQKGVEKALLMGQYMDGTADGEHAELRKAVRDIEAWAKQASLGIEELIRGEQSKMEADMDARMAQLQEVLGGILPPTSVETKRTIAAATHVHVEVVSAAIETSTASAPAFKPSLGMGDF